MAMALPFLCAMLLLAGRGAAADESVVTSVDVGAFLAVNGSDATRHATARRWHEALAARGFARVVGHGVPLEVADRLHEAGLNFFSRPLADKLATQLDTCYGGSGYTAMGVEAVGRTGDTDGPDAAADLVESFVVNQALLEDHTRRDPAIEPLLMAAAEFWREATRLVQALHELSAMALGLETSFFDPFYTPDPSFALRLAYYPPVADGDMGMRYGPHTDYQGFTVLRQDPTQPGLEIFSQDGEWQAVEGDRESLLINVGDLFSFWTCGEWPSTLHRVVRPRPGSLQAAKARLSLVFFTGPRDDAVIAPLPTCAPQHPTLQATSVVAGEHLRAKLSASNV